MRNGESRGAFDAKWTGGVCLRLAVRQGHQNLEDMPIDSIVQLRKTFSLHVKNTVAMDPLVISLLSIILSGFLRPFLAALRP